MARGFNQVILMGNLTRDIEVRFLPNGNQAVGNFGIAVNRQWRTPEGETREEVTFVDCEVWGKQAEVMKQYLAKGRPVFIMGRLKLDTWTDKTDQSKRSKLKVVVEDFRFMDSKPGGGGGGAAGGYAGGGEYASEGGEEPAPAPSPRPQVRSRGPVQPVETVQEDDIPF
ncbi:MAG: single-stranded DNA-binding protein [Planctomycetaceae bacterium]|jgi:single-strand DNA-binding protein|nr:single-stranded DNA-binding protein [Phycisphaerales bacterium]MCE2652125.1 single-stranded DNA-binding protein [Planctomycetaceae bacterium]